MGILDSESSDVATPLVNLPGVTLVLLIDQFGMPRPQTWCLGSI